MLFDTLTYWLFFAGFLAVYYAAPFQARIPLLLGSSYIFYAFWDWRFVLLLGGSSIANFYFGLNIERYSDGTNQRIGRYWLTAGIGANLLVLAFFKYANFFIDSLATLFGWDPAGLLLNILLPVGISFYTFEGVAYCSDVYRKAVPAERNLARFCVFMAFFPHLAAGPVIRPSNFFPQLARREVLDEQDLRWGLLQIIKGLIKKMVFADSFAPIANACFAEQLLQGLPVPVWVGVLAFAMQIYFDFAGYTDIARGCARLLGFDFPSNFERPYLSANIAEFWRCWHISLSTWLRDYLYIPLGGNRQGPFRTYLNLILVMTLGGLWHGASWNFVIWGFYHGVLLGAHRFLFAGSSGPRVFRVFPGALWQMPLTLLTFVLVSVGWIPFRARDPSLMVRLVSELPGSFSSESIINWRGPILATLGVLAFCLADKERRLQSWLVDRASLPSAAASFGLLWWFLSIFANVDAEVPFIYFQF